MFSGTREKREKNPRENATWISIVTFTFARKIFEKAFRRDFQEDDVFDIMQNFESAKLGDTLEKEFRIERKEGIWWLVMSILRMVWKQFLFLELYSLSFQMPAFIIPPILIGKITSYFVPGQTDLSLYDVCIYTGGLAALTLFHIIADNTYLLLIAEMSFKVRIACCSLLYRKCLKLTETSLSKCADGLAVTLLTKDVRQFDEGFDTMVLVLNGMLQAVGLIYVSYIELGITAICGLVFMLLLFPIHGNNLLLLVFDKISNV